MTKTATTLVTGRCRGLNQLGQHPDRQCRLLTSGECRHDNLIEGQRKGEHAAGKQRGPDLRQNHVTEGLEAVGAEIHRRLDQIAREPPEAGDGVIVDDHDAERGVPEHDSPDREIDAHDVEGRAQRYAGNDAGQSDRQNEQQRDGLAAEELGARQRSGRKRAEDERKHGRDHGNLKREIERRPNIRPVEPGDVEPFGGVAGRRKLEALFLGGEGVEQDQRQGQVQKQEPGDGRDAEAERFLAIGVRGHRTPPCASPPTNRCP